MGGVVKSPEREVICGGCSSRSSKQFFFIYFKKKRKLTSSSQTLAHTPAERNPTRHATVKAPLQSEASLKRHFHCLGPRAASQVTHASGWPPRRSRWAPCWGV